ncbi:LLM class flavin-dependent oxidoreductase [Xylophilus sp.]|uniref:LLM class flavin-dependent oxidoreductase n=1 Tax=Xylophilus sp. TaxID=2653893 RepID=UPI0013BDBA46|nr:LLM class flavin-dependent oxidoreductase [Xylophilus sp.]KAF1045899.1 MAG: Nitrilotriacetate monooxygenase component A [Xylophilus sp.]
MTTTAPRQLHLNINALNAGVYASAWRWPASDPGGFADLGHYLRIARLAEKAKFDAIFLADTPAIKDRIDLRPINALEPTVVLAAIAASTTHLGLIGTASTSFNEPYNIARRFATLDRISGGRAAWNIVTTGVDEAARNFGQDAIAAHGQRYERAAEFADVVRRLWHSWDDDALVGDKARALLVDPAKLHAVDHHGEYFRVQGALTTPRSPQGHPVLVQAGGSDDGRGLAARHAEAIFTVSQTIEDGVAYAKDVRERATRLGRNGAGIVLLPGLSTVIGDTEAAARQRHEALADLIPPAYGFARLSSVLHRDVSTLDLDAPLPDDLAPPADGHHTAFHSTVGLARRENLTLRQLLRRLGGGIGHRVVIGTPEQVADDIARWFAAGAADGFNLMPDVLADGFEAFTEQVVPLLQRKGIFRREYEHTTLRGHLGLGAPEKP